MVFSAYIVTLSSALSESMIFPPISFLFLEIIRVNLIVGVAISIPQEIFFSPFYTIQSPFDSILLNSCELLFY
jgi:hypothetical protein